MRFQVVDADQRQPAAQRQSLGGVHPHHQRAGQARAARHGDGIHIRQPQVGLLQGRLDDGVDGADVLARGHLRENAAELGVQVHLGSHRVEQDHAPVFDDGGGGLVAGGLDPQDAGRRPGKLGRCSAVFLFIRHLSAALFDR